MQTVRYPSINKTYYFICGSIAVTSIIQQRSNRKIYSAYRRCVITCNSTAAHILVQYSIYLVIYIFFAQTFCQSLLDFGYDAPEFVWSSEFVYPGVNVMMLNGTLREHSFSLCVLYTYRPVLASSFFFAALFMCCKHSFWNILHLHVITN